MEMTDEEIVKNYRAARDKKKQVSILADLNLCTKEKIIAVLTAGGVSSKELPRARRKTASVTKHSNTACKDLDSQKEEATAHKALDGLKESAPTDLFTGEQSALILIALQDYRSNLVKTIAEEQSKHEEFVAYHKERVQEIDIIMKVLEPKNKGSLNND